MAGSVASRTRTRRRTINLGTANWTASSRRRIVNCMFNIRFTPRETTEFISKKKNFSGNQKRLNLSSRASVFPSARKVRNIVVLYIHLSPRTRYTVFPPRSFPFNMSTHFLPLLSPITAISTLLSPSLWKPLSLSHPSPAHPLLKSPLFSTWLFLDPLHFFPLPLHSITYRVKVKFTANLSFQCFGKIYKLK